MTPCSRLSDREWWLRSRFSELKKQKLDFTVYLITLSIFNVFQMSPSCDYEEIRIVFNRCGQLFNELLPFPIFRSEFFSLRPTTFSLSILVRPFFCLVTL